MVGQHQNAIWFIKSAVSDDHACELYLKTNSSQRLLENVFIVRVSSDIGPLDFQSIPELYMIYPKAAEAPLSRVKEHKGTGPDEIPN